MRGLDTRDAAQGVGLSQVNFGSVIAVAIVPVRHAVQYRHHVDGPQPISDEEYLDRIRAAIDRRGVVIASLQWAKKDGSKLVRIPSWHMLSLFARNGDDF